MFGSLMDFKMVRRTPHPGPLPTGSADSAGAEREKRALGFADGMRWVVRGFNCVFLDGASLRRLLQRCGSRALNFALLKIPVYTKFPFMLNPFIPLRGRRRGGGGRGRRR